MKRWTARWTMAATAAALLTLPLTSAAQSTPPQPPPSAPQTAGTTSTQQQPNAEAQEHLRKARATLDDVKTASLNARARTHVNELKKRLTALERAAGANDQASATGQAQRKPGATAARGNVNWGTEVAAIDKTLTTLLGPASAAGASNPTAGTTGTAGTTKPKASAVTLDDDTRTKLSEFRTHITAFATAMAGGTAAPPTAETTSASGTSATAAAGTTGTAGTTGSTTSGATGTTGTTPQTPPTDPQQTQPAAQQADQEAARRHLTEARNSLSAMTQLPAASQLQGEARTQISQLITNFNELITTQAEWRASYAKVEANLTSLIGADPEASQSTGVAGTTGTTGTTGTPATAGTSGAASGMADLDPAIREKLVELRRHLNLFEKAAGGSNAGGTADPSAPAATSAASPTSAATGTATSGATGTTGSPTGTATSGTTSTTGTTASGQQTTPAQGNQAELAKHLAAIDTLLQTTDESGGLTLTKAQVEQLRTHWAALRQLLNDRR